MTVDTRTRCGGCIAWNPVQPPQETAGEPGNVVPIIGAPVPGQCRHNPPVPMLVPVAPAVVGGMPGFALQSVYPGVLSNDGCRQWRRKS